MAIVPSSDVIAFLMHGEERGAFRRVGPGEGIVPPSKPTALACALFAMKGRYASSYAGQPRGGSRPHLEMASAIISRVSQMSNPPQERPSCRPAPLDAEGLYALVGGKNSAWGLDLMQPMNSRQLNPFDF